MSLKPSKSPKNRRWFPNGLIAVCLFSLFSIGYISKASSSDLEEPETSPTPIPLPTQAATPVPSPSPSGSPSVPVRNLSQYENAGTISITGTDAAREAALTLARSFLLRKWNARSRGRVILAVPTLGTTLRPQSFFIEPNDSGVWKITIEIANEDPSDFFFVEEIGVDANGQPILPPNTGTPVTRALHLKSSASTKSGLIL